MTYKDYPPYTKAYVLVHNTGCGVQEAPYKAHDVVYETDSWEDAASASQRFKELSNTKEEVQSGWCNNTYHINVNTLSPKGKELYEQFSREFDARLEEVKKDSEYYEFKDESENTYHFKKHPLFDPTTEIAQLGCWEGTQSDKMENNNNIFAGDIISDNPQTPKMRIFYNAVDKLVILKNCTSENTFEIPYDMLPGVWEVLQSLIKGTHELKLRNENT